MAGSRSGPRFFQSGLAGDSAEGGGTVAGKTISNPNAFSRMRLRGENAAAANYSPLRIIQNQLQAISKNRSQALWPTFIDQSDRSQIPQMHAVLVAE